MMHNDHQRLVGYDEGQIWHDGCEECEHRGQTIPYSIYRLDRDNLRRAYKRSQDWANGRLNNAPISRAERPLLEYLTTADQILRLAKG